MFLGKSIDVRLNLGQTKVIPKNRFRWNIENYCKMVNEFCTHFESWLKILIQKHDLKVLIPWKGLLWALKGTKYLNNYLSDRCLFPN